MKNKLSILTNVIFLYFISITLALSNEQFVFDVTKIEITNNGNIYKGKDRGIIKTNSGITIKANNFEYNKKLNVLIAKGNVIVVDDINDVNLNAKKITYKKNEELIFSDGDTEALIKQIYKFNSSNVIFLREKKELLSKNKTTLIEKNLRSYQLENFKFNVNKNLLSGKTIILP